MAADASVKAKLEVEGRQRVRSALEGTKRDAQRAARETQAAARRTAKEAEKAARDTRRAQEREAKAATAAVTRSLRDQEREYKRLSREAERSARSQQRLADRASRGAARTAQRSSARAAAGTARTFAQAGQAGSSALQGLVGIGGIASVGVALQGVLSGLLRPLDEFGEAIRKQAGIVGAAEGAQRGAQTRAEIFRRSADALPGEVTPGTLQAQQTRVEGRLVQISETTGTPIDELVRGLGIAQDEFSQFEGGLDTLDEIAIASQATGASIEDLTRLLGEASDQLGIAFDSEGASRFFAVLRQQGKEGALPAEAFAGPFARSLGEFQRLTGRGGPGEGTEAGLAAFREFGALAQVVRKGGGSPEEVATRTSALFRSLSDPEVQERLGERGVFVREFAEGQRQDFARDRRGRLNIRQDQLPTGAFRNLADIAGEIEANPQLQTLEQIQEVFPEIRGAQAVGAISATGRSALFRQIQNVDEAAGLTLNQQTAQAFQASAAGQIQRVGAEVQARQFETSERRATEDLSQERLYALTEEEAPGFAAFQSRLGTRVISGIGEGIIGIGEALGISRETSVGVGELGASVSRGETGAGDALVALLGRTGFKIDDSTIADLARSIGNAVSEGTGLRDTVREVGRDRRLDGGPALGGGG